MSLPSKRVFFENYSFDIYPNVYEPAEDSFFFAQNLVTQKNDFVLDVGTGCGLLSVVAAGQGSNVISVDLNPSAVLCAQANARQNGFREKISVVRADLFGSIADGNRFDLILFNSPYVPAECKDDSWLEYSWSGGKSGRQVIGRFIEQSAKHLRHTGEIWLLQSTLAGVDKTISAFRRSGFDAQVAARLDLPMFETLVLIKTHLK